MENHQPTSQRITNPKIKKVSVYSTYKGLKQQKAVWLGCFMGFGGLFEGEKGERVKN
jgi:hypothetical protein